MALALTRGNLAQIQTRNPNLSVPNYLDQLSASGIVHIGPGNFHLGHLAYFVHQLLQTGTQDALPFGITGVSLRTPDRRNVFRDQDYLYTLVEQSGSSPKFEVCGAVREILFAPEQYQSAVQSIVNCKIVSLAMTGNGYFLDSDGRFMVEHPDIQQDLDTVGLSAKTAWGLIAAGLRERMANGQDQGFTVLSCDNIVHNGDYTKNALLAFLTALGDDKLLAFAQQKLTFPNGMVDRIVPETKPGLSSVVADSLGFLDGHPVPAERLPQIAWVIEDNFAAGRPAFDQVGAMFVEDVTPYEKMKLRLLNASHSVIACLGDLVGHTYIYETMQDPLIRNVMAGLMGRETVKTLDPVPGVNLADYQAELVERFSNTAVEDTVARVARDAPLQTVLDSMRDRLAKNESVDFLTLGLAAWIRRAQGGPNEQGREIIFEHPDHQLLREKVAMGSQAGSFTDPRHALGIKHLFGDLGTDPRVVTPVTEYLKIFAESGVQIAMQTALRNTGLSIVSAVAGPIREPKA
jgi:fructuronate reductase/mannitol 2-dehydrogenase